MADLRDGAVVGRDGRTWERARLLAAAQQLAAELPAAMPGSHVAFAFESDHAAFVVATWAAWLRGHAVALPADARRTAVAATLQLAEVVAFLHDTGAGRGIDVAARAVSAVPAIATLGVPIGSVTACLPQPNDVLERRSFPAEVLQQQVANFVAGSSLRAGDRLVVTYAPGHLPALVPGVLGPLQLGATVDGAALLTPDDLRVRVQHATALLSSPDRLRRLAKQPVGTWAALRWVGTLGDVDDLTAAAWRQSHGIRVQELASRTAVPSARALEQALLAVDAVEDVAVALAPDGRWLGWVGAPDATPTLTAELTAVAAAVCPGEATPLLVVHESLPRDANGDLPPTAVASAVGRRSDGQPAVRELAQGPAQPIANGWSLPVTVPIDYPGFDGHFHGYPVLSGVVQVHDLVLPALRRVGVAGGTVTEFAELKFLARIAPGDPLDLQLQIGLDGASATFCLLRGGTKCTTGRVRWDGR